MGNLFQSSVVKKLVTGVTGIALVLFVVFHLIGNLLLFAGADGFNAYAHFLKTFLHGGFLYFAEAGLIVFFLGHIVAGVRVSLEKRRSRLDAYQVKADAGGASRKTTASLTMIFSGIALLVFVVLHLIHFKYGPGEKAGYLTVVHGETMRDVYRLVVEEFNKPVPAFGYALFMLLLGLHLRHGFWSAFQSLGIASPRLTPLIQAVGVVLAVLLTVGFVLIPLYIYFAVPLPAGADLLSGVGS